MIIIVGNILKDIYLNLDSRTEDFEQDKHHTKWLNLAFNASEHHFFTRNSSLSGAAISLEVLSKLGLDSAISGSELKLTTDGLTTNGPAETYRYILITDGQTSYLTPSQASPTDFTPPTEPVEYIYIDRSAHLTANTIAQIIAYLDISQTTKLILYLSNSDNPQLTKLIPRASLIFHEKPQSHHQLSHSKHLTSSELNQALDSFDPSKIIRISDTHLSYQNISEPISINRINMLTHLSAYSIASATILGCFILGYSVEDSLKLARINLEHSKLNSTLTLDELQSTPVDPTPDLSLIASSLVIRPKGILAADESGGSIHKKFEQLNIPDTYDNRRDYRNIFFTTPNLEDYINGVILFDETARQYADNGQTFVDYLISKRIIPGIKVDQGLVPIEDSPNETYTKGLHGLSDRLAEYYQIGLRFAKWRSAFEINLDDQGNILTPTHRAITKNCLILAEYAKKCQSAGLVPIVEPEIVYDGNYSIDTSATVTGQILDALFNKLADYHVDLSACLLKCSMVIAGKQYHTPSTPSEVGLKTAETLKNHVPSNLAGIVFLSGGQTPEQATQNLSSITKNGPFPWPLTFSFARALQDPALYAWAGNNANSDKARQAFLDRLIANQQALQSPTATL